MEVNFWVLERQTNHVLSYLTEEQQYKMMLQLTFSFKEQDLKRLCGLAAASLQNKKHKI